MDSRFLLCYIFCMVPTVERDTRKRILFALKKNGGMTVGELRQVVGLSYMGVKQHLLLLERDGHVTATARRKALGRPEKVYALTPEADVHFPANYRAVTLELLATIEKLMGRKGVERLFRARQKDLRAQYGRRLKGSAEEKVRALAQIRDEEGYMCESWKDQGRLVLCEHHCPISAICREYPVVCELERQLFSKVLGLPVERVEHLQSGGRRCLYHIQK